MKNILITSNIILVILCSFFAYKYLSVDKETFFYSQLKSAGQVVVASSEQALSLNSEKGSLDKSKVEINWKETWRYYIDLAQDEWSFKINGDKFIFTAPEIKAFLPGTVDTNHLKTTIHNWSLFKGDYKHINDLIKNISKESISKINSSLLQSSDQKSLIEQEAEKSIKKLVERIAEKAGIKFSNITVIFN